MELYKARILFHDSSLTSLLLLLLVCPNFFSLRGFCSVFSSPHFESISTILTERKARCIFLQNDAKVQVLLAITPGR